MRRDLLTADSLRAAIEKQAKREARDVQAAAPPEAPGGPPAGSGPPADSRPVASDEPNDRAISKAGAVLERYGVRLIDHGGEMCIGLWGSLDGPEVRAALEVMGNSAASIIYFDDLDAGVPDRFKLCTCDPGLDSEPLPAAVIEAMKNAPRKPWLARNALLADMGWLCWTVGRPVMGVLAAAEPGPRVDEGAVTDPDVPFDDLHGGNAASLAESSDRPRQEPLSASVLLAARQCRACFRARAG